MRWKLTLVSLMPQDECCSIVEKVLKAKGAPDAFQNYLLTSTSNNISGLVYGRLYPYEHPRRRFMDGMLSELFAAIRTGGLVEFVPPSLVNFVSKLPSSCPTAIVTKPLEFIDDTM
ncbi:hypothetical protein V5799_006050 [Amblyomma americanum]|uniref:Uncharacterized protein n=1 Tax=Amblyomma americanum TaxID=6943 RepID=A0AAQ4DXI4_AMBAM